jgi:uncharacterized protein VirK/YbjX
MLFAAGSVGVALAWERANPQRTDAAPRYVPPRLVKGVRLATRMICRTDVVWRALQSRRQLAGVAHEAAGLSLAVRPFQPLCCAGWTEAEKLDRIVDHLQTTTRLGGIFRPERDNPRLLVNLLALGSDYSLKVDEPGWMMNDGLTVLSLWKGIDRLFSVSFLLSSTEGRLECHIGGLQGRGGAEMLDLYRAMTKEAHGLRPRDMTIELHRMVCRALGATRIMAVADDARFNQDRYFGAQKHIITSLSYDEAWTDRGGIRACPRWFQMPIDALRRTPEAIPAKKRSLYQKRYALLDALEAEVSAAVARGLLDQGLSPVPAESTVFALS